MNIPRWTAEASLYTTTRPFNQAQMTAGADVPDGVIRPQACDFECISEMIEFCSDLTGRARLQCIRAARLFCC